MNIGVSINPLGASVSYVIPASQISYIELVVSARLDVSPWFRYVTDAVVIVEDLNYSFSKALTDTPVLLDTPAITFTRPVTDSFGTQNPQPTFVVTKGLTDAATPLEVHALSVSKPLSDVASPFDTPSLTSGKSLSSEVPGFTDFSTQNLTKNLFDTVEMQDALTRFLIVEREFTENVPISDLVEKLFTPGAETDDVGVGDTYTPTFTKNVSDAFSLNDSSETGDGSTYSFAKYVNNVVFSSDNLASVLTKPLADSFGTSDSGSVIAQSYCDITYFAEDYVGASSSF